MSIRVTQPEISLGFGLEIFDLLLSITDKLMDKLPDYNQKKKEEYYEIRKQYEEQKVKLGGPDACHDIILGLRDELFRYVKTFNKEITGAVSSK